MKKFNLGDALSALENAMFSHPNYAEAWGKLMHSADRARDPRLEGRIRIIVGGTGDGKTTLMRRLEQLDWAQPLLDGPEGDIIPVKYVQVPTRVTPRALVSSIASAFGETPPRRSSAEDIVDFLVPIFEGVELRMLLLDESHWLMKGKSTDVQVQNAEFIKALLNRTKVTIILAGVKEIDELHDHLHDQFKRRLSRKIELKPYNWSEPGERKFFAGILNLYESAMALPKESMLGGPDLSKRLYMVSRGSLGIVVQYLSAALEAVSDRGGNNIQAVDLSLVHRDLSKSVAPMVGVNPGAFRAAVANVDDDPFLCSAAKFEQLWAKAFAQTKAVNVAGQDKSRKTRLMA